MNDKFDELAKGLVHSVTRRGALKKFGVGLAGIALAFFGLANKAQAEMNGKRCRSDADCPIHKYCDFTDSLYFGVCRPIPSSP
jgi:hypothetical protein